MSNSKRFRVFSIHLYKSKDYIALKNLYKIQQIFFLCSVVCVIGVFLYYFCITLFKIQTSLIDKDITLHDKDKDWQILTSNITFGDVKNDVTRFVTSGLTHTWTDKSKICQSRLTDKSKICYAPNITKGLTPQSGVSQVLNLLTNQRFVLMLAKEESVRQGLTRTNPDIAFLANTTDTLTDKS